MSPILKRKKEKFRLPSKYLLFIMTVVCIVIMIVSFTTNIFSIPLNYISSYLIVPFENGLTSVGTYCLNKTEEFGKLQDVLAENEKLKEEIDRLTTENTSLQQEKYELTKLRELYALDAEYDEYDKIGARIIARDAGNWYSNFVIDKGSNDGIQVNCNVIAGSGLVGRVIEVGPNHAKVTSIISDGINTSAMILATGDNLIVTGNLSTMKEGVVEYSQLVDSSNKVTVGDKVVTSNISDQYLPGILIGYINTLSTDSNNLTKSGYLTPVVDFEHLNEVLVIKQLKQQVN
ncbi:MAG: rod shape-determining protein MreC [Lachnospiraceae bacterium]|nr:rod shape-determining protein MreC [Lachnospiraceae bacterium]